MSIYHTILRYNTIYIICILYYTIHEHLRYTLILRNVLHTIQYISYDSNNYNNKVTHDSNFTHIH